MSSSHWLHIYILYKQLLIISMEKSHFAEISFVEREHHANKIMIETWF